MSPVISLDEAVARLAAMAAAARTAEKDAMMRACRLVRDAARQAIGHQEDAVGPFPAWAPLASATQAERVRAGFAPDAPLLRSGSLRDSIDVAVTSSGGRLEGVVGSASEIAVDQELGTARIPPRSFLGAAAVREAEAAAAELGHGVVGALSARGKGDARGGVPSV